MSDSSRLPAHPSDTSHGADAADSVTSDVGPAAGTAAGGPASTAVATGGPVPEGPASEGLAAEGPVSGGPRARAAVPEAAVAVDESPAGHAHWFDDDAGPVVRPYAMTRGRTSHAEQHRLDLIALVVAEPAADDPVWDLTLSPEHAHILELCRERPQSVAELAAELDLPIGVVRVLIGDLVDDELVHVTRPVPPAELPDESILREVIDGLRAL